MFGSKMSHELKGLRNDAYFSPQTWDWILPPWYYNQNNPLHPDYSAGNTDFYNYSGRNWTFLRAEGSRVPVRVDQHGIIYLSEPRISIEVWLYHQLRLYTPGDYYGIRQRFTLFNGGLHIGYLLDNGTLSITIAPEYLLSTSEIGIKLYAAIETVDPFEPVIIALVVRPYDDNGFAPIYTMEYKDLFLRINDCKVLHFMEEPRHSFFSNCHLGDVSQYFRFWEGNTDVKARDGSCTGMLGFSNIPFQLRPVMITIPGREKGIQGKLSGNSWKNSVGGADSFLKIVNVLNTSTRIDLIFKAGIRHLATMCLPEAEDPLLIMVLNRYGLTDKSRWYLRKSLQKVRWDGAVDNHLNGLSLIFLVADYYQISRDNKLVETYWSVLSRIGLWLCNQTISRRNCDKKLTINEDFHLGRYERCLWICASLSALAELGNILGKNNEIQVFENHFLYFWTRAQKFFLDAEDCRLDDGFHSLNQPGGRELIEILGAAYPHQLLNRRSQDTLGRINRVLKNYLFQGGVFSPRDFKGISLELTARLCQVMIRESLEYQDVLESLLTSVSSTFVWPDYINPLTKKGIGVNGHDSRVLYQVLLLIRSLFIIEEGDSLYLLPGVFCSDFWKNPQIEIEKFPTKFGVVSIKVRSVGGIIQINLESNFRQYPQKIIFAISQKYRVIFADTCIETIKGVITTGPDLRVIRFRKGKE